MIFHEKNAQVISVQESPTALVKQRQSSADERRERPLLESFLSSGFSGSSSNRVDSSVQFPARRLETAYVEVGSSALVDADIKPCTLLFYFCKTFARLSSSSQCIYLHFVTAKRTRNVRKTVHDNNVTYNNKLLCIRFTIKDALRRLRGRVTVE